MAIQTFSWYECHNCGEIHNQQEFHWDEDCQCCVDCCSCADAVLGLPEGGILVEGG